MAEAVTFERQLAMRSLAAGWLTGHYADAMAAVATDRFFTSGAEIFRRDETVEYIYMLVEGSAELEDEKGNAMTFESPAVLGVLDASLGGPHRRTAYALTDVRVYTIAVSDWTDLAEENLHESVPMLASNASGLVDMGAGFAPADDAPLRPTLVPPPGGTPGLFERLMLIRLTRVFGDANIQSLISLARHATDVSLAPGEVLFTVGDATRDIYIVRGGQLLAERGPHARHFMAASVVGDYMAFDDRPRAFSARADNAVQLFAIPFDDLYDVMEDRFDLWRAVARYLAGERLRLQTEASSPRSRPVPVANTAD